MRKHLMLASLLTAAIVGSSFLAAVPAASADTGADATDLTTEEIVALVTEVAPVPITAAQTTESSGQIVATLDGGGKATIAAVPDDGISVLLPDGEETMSVSLPGAGHLDDATVGEDGSVTYLGDANTPSINVIAGEEKIRASAIVSDPSQTERFGYDFGGGVSVEIQQDGSAIAYTTEEVTDPDTGVTTPVEKIVADVAAPWARDAAGIDVPTRYETFGSALVQVVEHHSGDYAYPIVADPTFDRPNFFQYRMRFNRAETAIIYDKGLGALGGLACGTMAPVCLLAAGSLVWNAGIAEKSRPKKCVQVTATQPYVIPGLVWWVDTYRGGPCR